MRSQSDSHSRTQIFPTTPLRINSAVPNARGAREVHQKVRHCRESRHGFVEATAAHFSLNRRVKVYHSANGIKVGSLRGSGGDVSNGGRRSKNRMG